MGFRSEVNPFLPQRTQYVTQEPLNIESLSPVKPRASTTVRRRRVVDDEDTQYYKAMDFTSGISTPETPQDIKRPLDEEALNFKLEAPGIPRAETPIDVIKQQGLTARRLAFIQAGAELFSDIFNAQSAYAATTGEARLNILQARNQAADALYRGRQARGEAESEGREAGETALLAMAAQGQDVRGAAVQKIQSSYEAMGVFNGMREEINSIREALGYQLQEVAYDYQIRNAGIARESAIIGAAINFGARGVGVL